MKHSLTMILTSANAHKKIILFLTMAFGDRIRNVFNGESRFLDLLQRAKSQLDRVEDWPIELITAIIPGEGPLEQKIALIYDLLTDDRYKQGIALEYLGLDPALFNLPGITDAILDAHGATGIPIPDYGYHDPHPYAHRIRNSFPLGWTVGEDEPRNVTTTSPTLTDDLDSDNEVVADDAAGDAVIVYGNEAGGEVDIGGSQGTLYFPSPSAYMAQCNSQGAGSSFNQCQAINQEYAAKMASIGCTGTTCSMLRSY